ncbi:uncharacterized protein LOC117107122 [Anneissia japonica]|uniref:uncharacterized protein LOC117107122 n=1 Tax=Anneissia japonica TaxID=1529436 RepID=UPI001425AAB4|nr:uncharacterized protein LOC117107122 [Anneissia japonica]
MPAPKDTQALSRFLETDLSDDQYSSMVEWLKHNTEPLSQVKSFMEKTAVELDFRAIFPDVSDKLCMLWTPVYAGEVLKYATLQGGNWQTYLNVKESILTSDGKKVNVSLGLLPCILPPGRKAKKRASVDEALASYIDVKPVGTNLPKYLEEVSNTQPYVLILGGFADPLQCFTIVERRAIPQVSFLKAIDVCFKLFYILNLNYPWQSYTTWEFIQKVIYGLEDTGNHNKTSPAVIAMTALKKASKI